MATITGGTWTYSGDPSASSLDKVRFLIGDTDGADQLLSDEEILWAISSESSIFRAAAMCCEQIITAGRLVDKRVGDLEIRASGRARDLRALAAQLRRRGALSAVPWAGGISVTGKDSYESDTDRVTPAFEVGQFDVDSPSTST